MPTIDPLRIDHVQVAMPVGGEAAARAFFGGMLGLPEIPKPPALAARGGCWFAVGALQLHLGAEADFRPARKAHVALCSSSIGSIRQRLEAAGITVYDEASVGDRARFFTADPFGNRIEFIAA